MADVNADLEHFDSVRCFGGPGNVRESTTEEGERDGGGADVGRGTKKRLRASVAAPGAPAAEQGREAAATGSATRSRVKKSRRCG